MDYVLELDWFEIYSLDGSPRLYHGRVSCPHPKSSFSEFDQHQLGRPRLMIGRGVNQFIDPMDLLHVCRPRGTVLDTLPPTPSYSPIFSNGKMADVDYALLVRGVSMVGRPDPKRLSGNGKMLGIGFASQFSRQFCQQGKQSLEQDRCQRISTVGGTICMSLFLGYARTTTTGWEVPFVLR